MKTSYKIFLMTPVISLTMAACKAYENTVVMVNKNKVLMVDKKTSEERLLDCSKKTADMPNLISDLPYFREGDVVKFKPGKSYTYDGFRAFKIEDSQFEYNKDTIQIRKDKELIEKFKREAAVKDSLQHVR